MTAIPCNCSITEHARDLIKKSLGKKVRGKDNIVFRIKLFAELLNGDQKAGWLLNQIIYWGDRTNDPDGWFWKTYREWHEEIGLSEREIRRIVKGDKRRKTPKKTLQDVGIEVMVRRAPTGSPTMHYRVNQAIFFATLVDHLETAYDLRLDAGESTNGQDENAAMVTLETDHRAVENTRPSLDKTKILSKKNPKESNPTPQTDDEDEIAIFTTQEKRFGNIPKMLKKKLHEQIAQLGFEKSTMVIERCVQNGGRSWFYVSKSLKNEQIYTEKVENTQNHTAEETQNIYNINDWTDSEESYTEQRARIKAEEEARWRKCYPAIEPFERTQAPLNINDQLLTAQAAWEMVCDKLKKRFGSTTYRLLLGDAVLVDFNPENETFIVIVRHLRNSNAFYQGHYQTIQQVLADVYGSMKVNMRLLTRVDWANYKKSISA